MKYADFMVLFDEAQQNWGFGKVTTDAAAVEIERLRALVPQPESDLHRRRAEFVLADFAEEISPESRDRMRRASAVLGAASDYEGPIDEHIARAEQGIRDITSIGMETGNEGERYAIISMNSALATLVADRRQPIRGDAGWLMPRADGASSVRYAALPLCAAIVVFPATVRAWHGRTRCSSQSS